MWQRVMASSSIPSPMMIVAVLGIACLLIGVVSCLYYAFINQNAMMVRGIVVKAGIMDRSPVVTYCVEGRHIIRTCAFSSAWDYRLGQTVWVVCHRRDAKRCYLLGDPPLNKAIVFLAIAAVMLVVMLVMAVYPG